MCPHHPYIVSTDSQILPWVHEKFTVKFTMSNVDGCTIYMHIGCPNYSEKLDAGGNKITIIHLEGLKLESVEVWIKRQIKLSTK